MLGDPKTGFAFEGVPPNQRSRALYLVQWKIFGLAFKYFFSKIYLSAILEIFIEIFSDIFFFEAFVSVLFQLTRTCSIRVVTTFTHFLRWLEFFFCKFIWADIFFLGKFILKFIQFFLLFTVYFMVLLAVIDMYRPDRQ